MSRERTCLTFNPLTRQPWIGLEGESGGQGGVQSIPAVAAAPEQEVTATPESVETPPEEEPEEKPAKLFTQEELDRIVGKEKARERRKWEREQTNRTPEKSASTEALKPDQFETWEDYAEALSEHKAQEKINQRDQARQRTELESNWDDREEEAREKFADYEQVVRNKNLRISDVMAETIMSSEIGTDIAYYLGLNPKEAARIFELPPLQQAREIGKLEVKVSAESPVKKASSAPAPIAPVIGGRSGNPSYDTTDPRSIKAMSDSEWITAERQRQVNKLKAASQF